MSHALIYQDNKIMILLEANGKVSSSKRTNHIRRNTYILQITDKLHQKEIKIEHMLTERM